jgi:NADH dehydrogenase
MKEHAFQIENIHTARELSRHIEDKFANYAAILSVNSPKNSIPVNPAPPTKIAKSFSSFSFDAASASKEKDENDLAILVGGAGFTGIEFLGELTDRIPEYLQYDEIIREQYEYFQFGTHVLSFR